MKWISVVNNISSESLLVPSVECLKNSTKRGPLGASPTEVITAANRLKDYANFFPMPQASLPSRHTVLWEVHTTRKTPGGRQVVSKHKPSVSSFYRGIALTP